ncbi:hypothetical protein CALCODRAFT_509282 [Calocera cornea HHB12733]|uniref:Uncharacterized protein n=1 Tax=Calocera cornea HHB12733 TaxID=1353952 RepID=A0A165FH33_9BASI|nr:hypothetical protein CALCODRAFT_509282 [Calocera cornea HHB12733]
MPSTLFAPAPVRSVTHLPPLDLGTAGPGRYPTMAELRSFPPPAPDPPMRSYTTALPPQQQQQGSWYARERTGSGPALAQGQGQGQGPPTVQGKRERRDSAGAPAGPPTRRANVRIVMPAPLSSPPQPPQQQQQQRPTHQRQAQSLQIPPQGALVVTLPNPQPQQQQQRPPGRRASALPPTTQPRGASRSPPSQPAIAFPTTPGVAARPRPPSAPPAPAQETKLEEDAHPARGPFLAEQKGHRILRKRLLSFGSPSPSSSPPAPAPAQPEQQQQQRQRRRVFSFGRKPAPAPIAVPAPAASRPAVREKDGNTAGSPVEIRFGGASVHRDGRYEEPERGRLRVVNGGPEPPSAVDAQGDVLMRDHGGAGAGAGYPTRVPAQQQHNTNQGIATLTLPRAPAPGAAPAPMRLQTTGDRPAIFDIVRPEPRYAANHAPVAPVAPVPPLQNQNGNVPPVPQVHAAQPVPPPPPSIPGTNYYSPEPAYPSRAVAYDVPNPYRPPSAGVGMGLGLGLGTQSQSAPASVARSTYSLPSSGARSVRGAETDTEVHARARAPAPSSRLFDESQSAWQAVYGDQGTAAPGMGNVRATAGGGHRAHLTYEQSPITVIAAAAGFAAMRLWEDHEAQQGKQPKHSLAKEILAALAAAEVDRLAETKGLDWLDKEKAKRDAAKRADQLAAERYPDGQGQQQPHAQGQGQGQGQGQPQQHSQGPPPREHPPPGSSSDQGQGRLRAPPQYQAPSAPASAASWRSSTSAGSRPPITLFVPPANSPWAARPAGGRPASGQQQQQGHAAPHHGETDMAALREEEARRHVLIKRDYAHRP